MFPPWAGPGTFVTLSDVRSCLAARGGSRCDTAAGTHTPLPFVSPPCDDDPKPGPCERGRNGEEKMSSAPISTPTLSDSQIAELLETLKGADSVELKLTVPEAHQRSATAALELDPLEAQIRQVFFFDTPGLALDASGVVVRARRIQGKGGDSIVKLRPVVPSELPDDLRLSKAFRVEVDALPGGFVCSGTLEGTPDPADRLL